MSHSSLRSDVLAVLLRALSQDGTPCFPATATFTDANGGELTFRFVRYDVLVAVGTAVDPLAGVVSIPPVGDKEDADQPRLRRIHFKLYEKCSASTPTPTTRLIQSCGYNVNSYTRQAVTHMVQLGYLKRSPVGGLIRGSVELRADGFNPDGDEDDEADEAE